MEEASTDQFNHLLGTATMEYSLEVDFEFIETEDN
jgi:hypothetical protein